MTNIGKTAKYFRTRYFQGENLQMCKGKIKQVYDCVQVPFNYFTRTVYGQMINHNAGLFL